MKFLIIRFSSIGDIVLTTPVIRCLKQQLPGSTIHFLTKRNFKAVTEHNHYIDKFFYYDNNLKELKQELKKENYDYVIDLHKNFRSYLLRFSLGAKTLSYHKESIRKFLLTKFHIDFMVRRHIVLRNLDTVKPVGVENDGKGLDYFIDDKDVVSFNDLPSTHANGFVGIVIGASYFTKKLPVYKLQEVVKKINEPVILIGGKEDEAEGDEIASADRLKVYNACGKFRLNQSADLVRKAKLVISHDTGLLYIACAFNRPTIAIWGGTSPKLDVESYYGNEYSTANHFTYKNFVLDLSCQPCSNFGTAKCPLGHFKCMHLQDVNAIAATVREVIQS